MDFLLLLPSGEVVLLNGKKKRLQLSKRICSFIRVGTRAVFGEAGALALLGAMETWTARRSRVITDYD